MYLLALILRIFNAIFCDQRTYWICQIKLTSYLHDLKMEHRWPHNGWLREDMLEHINKQIINFLQKWANVKLLWLWSLNCFPARKHVNGLHFSFLFMPWDLSKLSNQDSQHQIGARIMASSLLVPRGNRSYFLLFKWVYNLMTYIRK